MKLKVFSPFLVTFLLVACAESQLVPTLERVGTTAVIPLTKQSEDLKQYSFLKDGSLAGSGLFRGKSPMREDCSHYRVQLELLNDKSKFELISHADSKLQSGILVRLLRTEDSLAVSAIEESSEQPIIGSDAGVPAKGLLTIGIDVHHEGEVIVWPEADKANHEHVSVASRTGKFWGFVLENARIRTIEVGPAKEDDHDH